MFIYRLYNNVFYYDYYYLYEIGTPNGQPTTIWSERIRYFLWVGTRVSIKSKEKGKYQESIQLVPHLAQKTLLKVTKVFQ